MDRHSQEDMPALSFIVPAYNAERYIERCLDSLVFQTRQDIEIIIVDDGSTDSTPAILEKYRYGFPSLIKIITQENGGPSSARANGVKSAVAPFVSFVDSDDWIHPSTAQLFLEKAEQGADFVYAAHAVVRNDSRNISASCSVIKSSLSEIIRHGNTFFPGKLWSKNLLMERASFPSMLHEDVAEVPALISWTKRPAVIQKPLYFYYKDNVESRTSAGKNPNRTDLFKADLMCWEKMNPEYLDDFKVKLAIRLGWNLDYVEVYDQAVEYAKWAYDYFNLKDIESELNDRQLSTLRSILESGQAEVPARVILNGFPGNREKYDVAAIQNMAFFQDCEIVWIDESCLEHFRDQFFDIDSSQIDDLAALLACGEIYERGGVYLSSSLQIIRPLNSLRMNSACFARRTRDSFSTDFFCGAPRSSAFELILNTCKVKLQNHEEITLTSVLRKTLVCEFGIHLDGEDAHGRESVCVFGCDWLHNPVRNTRPQLLYNYPLLSGFGNSIAVPKNVFEEQISGKSQDLEDANKRIKELKRDRERIKEDRERLKAEREYYKKAASQNKTFLKKLLKSLAKKTRVATIL